MSGGHFDYGCHRVSQFAEELQHEIDINYDNTKDEYGDTRGMCFSANTMKRIMAIQKIIEFAGKIARETEWLYSGDHGEESYMEITDKILNDIKYRRIAKGIFGNE